ncbi:MAG: hypothetical protein LCI00_26025 [Chloroflexi bacterium]|nr:hypothetical protein [Chloroflexota bacterium]MCC6895317.1 hypothetical protein [Anaerolineae bacterium]
MSTMISIPIPEPLANIYERASDADKVKAQWLIEVVLNDLFHNQSDSLANTVKEMSQKASERGLTPDILDELLKDDE